MTMSGNVRARKLGLYFSGWTLAGLFFFSQSETRSFIMQGPGLWWGTLAHYLTGMYVTALLVPAILWPARRWPIERRIWPSRVGIHLLLSIAFSLLILALAVVIDSWAGLTRGAPHTFWTAYRSLLIWDFHAGVSFYWLLVGGDYALRYYRRYQEGEKETLRLALHAAELERQLASAQLHALKAQLHPHFLFNTLNAIMVLVRRGAAKDAEETLALLGDLLRCALEDIETQEVPLRRELEFLRLYLAIEHVRFRDRLRVEMFIAPETLDAAVPHLALQPIVENAIRHGIGRSSTAGRIAIRAQRVKDLLEIEVRDDGPGLGPPGGGGMGLSNVRGRLAQLYGISARLTVENAGGRGVVAALSVPYRLGVDIREKEMGEFRAAHSTAG